MSKGIYKYTDLKTGDVVYVGKDSHIDKNQRHGDHLRPSNYNQQQINRVLQNNPDRYEYGVIWATEDCTTLKLNKMEILFGKIYNPKFNFDKFGKGGCTGHTEESKKKLSEANKGKNCYWYNKSFSKEHRKKLSEAKKGKYIGKDNPSWHNYATIHKAGFSRGKQRYAIRFNGKDLKFSIYPDKLLNWFSENYPHEILKIPKKEDL